MIVGSLAESYYFGIRMYSNIFAVLLGYVYAFFLVLPLTTNLDESIKTPYQYFERRYGSRKYVRIITAFAGMIFYFSFLTLYLWGCTIMISTIIPQLPLYASTIILGIYSVLGSIIGGYTQSTRINVFQFSLVLCGLILACLFTIKKAQDFIDFGAFFDLAAANNRTDFFDERVDLTTRYTVLNQLISLTIPWTCIHSLLLPNFMRYRSIKGTGLKRSLAVISNFPFMVLINSVLLVAGSMIVFLYFLGCDPLSSGKIVNKNQTGSFWIFLIFDEYAPTFTGIFFSSIVCYSVVQHSNGIALCANTIYCEILNPVLQVTKIRLREHTIKIFKMILTIFLGLFSILYAIGFQFVKNTSLSLFFIFNNSTNSPILGLFFLSAFNPYANHVGAMTAFVINLCINYWWAMGHLNLYSNTGSQSSLQTTALCDRDTFQNLTAATYDLSQMDNPYNISEAEPPFYPENQVVYFFYTMAPIWYCMFSLLFNLIFGSLFSFIYSLIKSKSFDVDSDFKEERKQYLYIYKVREKYFNK